jgi:hypothetical protein
VVKTGAVAAAAPHPRVGQSRWPSSPGDSGFTRVLPGDRKTAPTAQVFACIPYR